MVIAVYVSDVLFFWVIYQKDPLFSVWAFSSFDWKIVHLPLPEPSIQVPIYAPTETRYESVLPAAREMSLKWGGEGRVHN